ncbi:MAG: L-aspartate oxidase [Ignavibacteria bacterium]|jgi:L-aspartate oxidase|nr:L-aspartate oxidase [Ignavibacteria bacterium]
MKQTDILIIGTGIAGSIAAITAADNGNRVTVLTKTDDIVSGSTSIAQGGIIYKAPDDTPEKLAADIMTAGAGHCWEPAVMQLATLGPKLVEDLLLSRFNVDFDKTDNHLDLTAEGAHSLRRIIHCKDITGRHIIKAIHKTLVEHPNITILTNHIAIDLLTLSHHSKNSVDIYKHPACFGAIVFDANSGATFPIFAHKTILATGGLGQIFLHTTNPREATGDGIALASRAGVRCFNLEYIQFHPTAFYNEHYQQTRFLISESMRGEGGKLIDKNGNEFMQRFHHLGSLAPRDVVARSIQTVLQETSAPCVFLDITAKGEDWLQNRFPEIFTNCLQMGVNISNEPIPVIPAAHYSCGGIGVNLNGRTSFQRLYAVGEISCTGVHGANRLASTSLLEALVWGYTAGNDVCISKEDDDYFPPIYDWVSETEDMDNILMVQDWSSIKNTMWNYVGLFRTNQRLQRAIKMLTELKIEIERFYKRTKLSREIIELRNGIETAIAVTNATIASPVSRGAHYIINNE